MSHDPRHPQPLYQRLRDLPRHGFTFDWVTALFIGVTHLVCLVGTPLAYYYAPEGFWKVMLAWTLGHAFIGCLSTTVYSHRLISHRAARVVRWPVHLLFGVIGQTLAAQGSVRHWAAMHVVHHSVDRTQRHELDPYSATWFSSTWRNFLWSHVLTFCFFHPESGAKDRAYRSQNHPMVVWQDRFYVPLLVLLNFLLPLGLGLWFGGLPGAICLMVAAIGGFVLAQHNTWTVNSVTHMWGFVRGASSSAKNNFVWLGPLGEGNHHADHHDFARDYRNGFGVSGWLLDPSRYLILLLNSLGLVDGLHRASKKQEAEILAHRKLLQARSRLPGSRWEAWEARLEHLKAEWLEATHQWEEFRKQHRLQLRNMHLPHLELEKRVEHLKAEMELARRAMRARKQAFLDALYAATTLGRLQPV